MWQVANAQTAGAKAAMVYDDRINDYFLMLADGGAAPGIGIPGMAVPRRVGQLLAALVQVSLQAEKSVSLMQETIAFGHKQRVQVMVIAPTEGSLNTHALSREHSQLLILA